MMMTMVMTRITVMICTCLRCALSVLLNNDDDDDDGDDDDKD